MVQQLIIDYTFYCEVNPRETSHCFNSSVILFETKQTLGSLSNEFSPCLSLTFNSLNDSAKKKNYALQFESLVEEFGISALQNFSYDNFLKILNPVSVFSFAHDVLLLLLQLRG